MNERVLIFSVAYEPLIGGAELAVRQITDRLSSFQFDLITCKLKSDMLDRERIGNVNVYRVGFGGRIGRYFYSLFAFRLARKLHKQRPYQIVWAIMAAYAAAAALMFVRKFAVKFLLTLQEGDSVEHIHGRVRGFRTLWQKAFQRADRIQAISNFLATWARQEGAVCEIDVVPNGVDLNKFKVQSSKFKVGDKRIMISASRLVPKNGIDILIRATAQLKALIPDSKFLIQILGSGSEEKKLKKLARDLKLEDLIEFKGEVLPEDVPRFLSEADIFVRPSRSEGLGSAFLEAMAAGLPVIGTAVGGIPDFLIDNKTGLIVKSEDPKDLAEKIQTLFGNEALRKNLSSAGRKLIEGKYSWEAVSANFDLIFKKLLT